MTESSDKIDSQRIHRLRRHPLGRYRYVRLRWRVTFAVIDLVGAVLFAAVRLVWRSVAGRTTLAPKKEHDPKVILLVQLDHLGDAIISTAMFPALRTQYPDASIEVLAAAWNREVFEALPEVDRVHVSRANRFARTGLARLAWIPATFWWGLWLRRRQVDLGIDVRGEFPVAVILWLCGARRRLGWDSGGGRFLLTDSPRFVADRPEIDSRRALLAALGIRAPQAESWRPRLRGTVAARGQIARRLAELPALEPAARPGAVDVGENCGPNVVPIAGGQRPPEPGRVAARLLAHEFCCPLVVLHVGAGTAAKTWPMEHWRELLGRIIVGHGAQVVLVGGRQDRIIADRIIADRIIADRIIADRILDGQVWPGVADWTGRLSVVELAALLERAEVSVGADSAPAHLAAAVGTPVVVLLSGTNNPRQWQPCGEEVVVIRHEVGCSPCHRERCPRPGHPCMKLIRPRQVAAEIDRLLRPRPYGHRDNSTAAATADEPSSRRKGTRP